MVLHIPSLPCFSKAVSNRKLLETWVLESDRLVFDSAPTAHWLYDCQQVTQTLSPQFTKEETEAEGEYWFWWVWFLLQDVQNLSNICKKPLAHNRDSINVSSFYIYKLIDSTKRRKGKIRLVWLDLCWWLPHICEVILTSVSISFTDMVSVCNNTGIVVII